MPRPFSAGQALGPRTGLAQYGELPPVLFDSCAAPCAVLQRPVKRRGYLALHFLTLRSRSVACGEDDCLVPQGWLSPLAPAWGPAMATGLANPPDQTSAEGGSLTGEAPR